MSYKDDITLAANVELPWERLSGKNILVTGATGLIGSCLVDILMNHDSIDYHVYASGRNERRINTLFSRYDNSPYFHCMKYDVTESLVSGIVFHFIIDVASGANPVLYSTDPVGVVKANVCGVDNLMSYGVMHGLEKFVYVSSGDVYGEGDGRVFTESYSGYVDPLNIRSCYTSSKRTAETLCISYSHQFGIDVSIARPCHTYGPHFTENDTRVYAQFIRNVLNGEDIILKSSGEQLRSWCYVVDCASALLFILFRGDNRQAYNIADESSNISILELAQLVAQLGDKRVVVDIPSEKERIGYSVISKSVFSTAKLRGLGWHALPGDIKEKFQRTLLEAYER